MPTSGTPLKYSYFSTAASSWARFYAAQRVTHHRRALWRSQKARSLPRLLPGRGVLAEVRRQHVVELAMAVPEGDRGLDERLRGDRQELDPVREPVAVQHGLPAPDPLLLALPDVVPVLDVRQGEAAGDAVELAALHVQE